MEQKSKSITDKILKNVCNNCLFIFANNQTINSQADTSDMLKSEEYLGSQNNSNKKTCKFCFGILNPENFSKIIEKIFSQLENHEFTDYKITTNFSPLFQLITAYVKILI
jgi:tRNA U54 and U55 pseudouridine synthase Pus10